MSNGNSTSPANTSGEQQTGLVLPSLGPVVRQLFSSGIANSTVRSYRKSCNRYVQFCVSAASEVGLCYFAYLFEEHLTSRTIRVYLVALRLWYTQIPLGLGDSHLPNMSQLDNYVKKRCRRLSIPPNSASRLRITPDTFQKRYGAQILTEKMQ